VQAFILAAGVGSRLRPYTDHLPKPMLPLAGRPILDDTIRRLAHHGVCDLVVNVHHLPETIRRYFGNGSRHGVHITYSEETRLLGTAGGVKRWEAHFTDTFFVIYGDNLATCDYHALLRHHHDSEAVVTVALHERDDVTGSGMVVLDEHNRITAFVEKPRAAEAVSRHVNAGILVLEPAVFQSVPPDTPWDFSRDVLPQLLAEQQRLFGYHLDEELIYIDRVQDYERTLRRIATGDLAIDRS